METQGQIFYFLACLFVGFCGGAVRDILSFLHLFFRKEKVKKVVRAVLDVLFFVAFGVVCCFMAALFSFPEHRLYMYAAYAFGWIIYLKSGKILLDFFKKVCYNTLTKVFSRKATPVPKGDKEKV